MAKAKDLAGLAALGYLGFKLHQQGKGDTTPTRAARPKSTETREDERKDFGGSGDEMSNARRDASSGDEMSKFASKYKAPNIRSDKVDDKEKPAPKVEAKVDAEKNSAAPTYMSKTPAGDKKRTEGNEPMPSLKAVESRAATRKASMSTDAMKNTSRAQQAGINRQKAMRANPEAQAAERVYPEELLVGGPGIKVVGAAAKNLANRGAKEIAEYSTPRLAAPAKQLTGPSKAELLARDRAARASSRQEEMLKENASRYGLDPKAPGYEGAAGAVRRGLGGDDFAIMKRGGMTKMASGGMTASRRGDGIASRGKTKCNMY